MTVAIALFTSPRVDSGYDDGRPSTTPTLRPACAACDDDDGPDLRADSRRRDDAAHGRGAGDSGLPADVRPPHPRSLGSRRSPSTSRIASARWSSTLGVLATSAHVWYAPPRSAGADAAGDADSGARRRPGDARRADGAQPARRLDQQPPRRLRRARADDVAGDHAAKLARADSRDADAACGPTPRLRFRQTSEQRDVRRDPTSGCALTWERAREGRPCRHRIGFPWLASRRQSDARRLRRAHEAASELARRRHERRRLLPRAASRRSTSVADGAGGRRHGARRGRRRRAESGVRARHRRADAAHAAASAAGRPRDAGRRADLRARAVGRRPRAARGCAPTGSRRRSRSRRSSSISSSTRR